MKSKIVLVLLVVLLAMTGIASAYAIAEYGEYWTANPPLAGLPYVEYTVTGSPSEDIEPIVTDTPVGDVTGSDSGYGQVSIAVPDQSIYEGDAIATVVMPLQVENSNSLWLGEQTWNCGESDVCIPWLGVPDVWIPEIPEQSPVFPEPDVGTCEFPGHPPCSPDNVNVWIMPQWFSWEFE